MQNERSYSEREVADIIERAVERQEAERRVETGTGLTLGDLERLGKDVGIDPKHLRDAASELDAVGRTLSKQSSATKTTIQTERWIDAPLTIVAWEDAVEEMRERYGPNAMSVMGQSSGGMTQQVGSSYEWTHTSGLGIQTRMAASERDGRTRLRISQLVGSASPPVEGAMYGTLAGFLLSIVSMIVAKEAFGMGKPDILVVFAVTALVSGLLLAPVFTVLDRRWRAKKHRELEALADELVPILGRQTADREASRAQAEEEGAGIGPPTATVAMVQGEPGLLLNHDDEVASTSTTRDARQRTRS